MVIQHDQILGSGSTTRRRRIHSGPVERHHRLAIRPSDDGLASLIDGRSPLFLHGTGGVVEILLRRCGWSKRRYLFIRDPARGDVRLRPSSYDRYRGPYANATVQHLSRSIFRVSAFEKAMRFGNLEGKDLFSLKNLIFYN